MKKVRLHKRFRTQNTSFAKDSRTNPVISNDGDIIAPPPKGSTRKGNKQNTQNNMNVPWANNKKKKTVLGDNIIWVHNEILAEEESDPVLRRTCWRRT